MRRFDRLEHILSLDPERDCETIYRLMAEYEFPWDITRALELALFRTYAVPSIGRLLDRTGQFTQCPQRRYDDTTLILYEIFHGGTSNERGKLAIKHLNRIHDRYRISNDDFRYTLAAFVVAPVRWINAYGWRKLHPREITAITNTMRRMGEGMRITGIPETYAEFETLLDEYERAHFGYDPGSRSVADATLKLFGSWYPGPLSNVVAKASVTLMDPHLVEAFGLPQPSPAARAVARFAMNTRASVVRLGPARPDSRPVAPDPLSYPNGYELSSLGPESFHRSQARRRERAGT